MNETLKEELVNSLPDAPLRPDDDRQAQPQNPDFGGEVGPSPGSDKIPAGDPSVSGDGKTLTETGEEVADGVMDAGGVDASNADGALRPDENRGNG